MISGMKNKLKKPALAAGSVVFWIAVWHIAALIANKNLLLPIPLPIDTLYAFLGSIARADFWQAVGASLLHIVAGFTAAVLIGVISGVLASVSPLFKALTDPIFHVIRAVPVAAFIIIAGLWIKSSVMPVFISCLMVMPIVKSHIDAGLLAVDQKNVEMASVFGMDKKGILRHIKIPTVMPSFRQGLITGLGIAWKSGVAAEVICNPTGSLGALLRGASSSIEYEQVFAVALMVVILSFILENILKICWKERKY